MMPIRTLTGAMRRRLNRKRYQFRTESAQYNHSQTVQPLTKNTLNLLSFNIQVGINTEHFRHYLTRSWQHILPHPNRIATLDRIAGILPEYDLVSLQEVDGGSLRSGFVNQTEYLALKGLFPFWYHQLNRNLGKFAQHSNGLLSRYQPLSLEDHKLPGLIPGRGAIVTRFGNPDSPLTVVMMHLALSRRARNIQLSYIQEVVQNNEHIVLMGDMNTHADQLLHDSPLQNSRLQAAHWGQNTFPSWQPKRSLDHILISPSLRVNRFGVVNLPISDHLPVSVEIQLPESILLSS
ncbi:endonuclease/exonuclease/phosphatase family protein [Endozoicomonas ascidiicola]|uniref:endonuclease/exonuclease/phosphatase family protein n=2 Tax=Endozoicomonas ascidiicola TaxID=1698521 RepID=UPI003454977F